MEAREATPYILAMLGILNTLLGLVYWNMRESVRELKVEIRDHKERFDTFKDVEIKAINEKLESVRKEVSDSLHRIELSLATGYATKAELNAIATHVKGSKSGG